MNCDVNVESNTNSSSSKVNCSNKQNDLKTCTMKTTTTTKDLCLAQIYAFIKEVVDTCLEGNSLQLKKFKKNKKGHIFSRGNEITF